MLYIDKERGIACSDQPTGSPNEEMDKARAKRDFGLDLSSESRHDLRIGPEYEE